MFCIPGPGDATPLTEKSRSNPITGGRPAAASTQSKETARNASRIKTARVDPRNQLGALGESRAASFLVARGYRIDARNVRYAGVEIDLIARRGALVVFVEVKTRRTRRYGGPELAVDARKQARMVRAAHAWLSQHRGASRRLRFDVVACSVERVNGRDDWKIDHWVGAFDASD